MNEIVKRVKIPIIADSVLSPQIHYGSMHSNEPITGIYFNTQDEQYGRITFENFDSLKICRGEMLPFDYNWGTHEKGVWVFKIEKSKWLIQRYEYEKEHYGDSYEFGGNVEEMKTDFNHYLFSFHDQFIEVIAKGFWFEKSSENLFGKQLQEGHPYLPISNKNKSLIEVSNLKCQVRIADTSNNKLIADTEFCTQKIMEFALELEGKATVNHKLTLSQTNGEIFSNLCNYFGQKEVSFKGIASLEDVRPYIEKYMIEVSERRKEMGK
jgi:hypothetical protein